MNPLILQLILLGVFLNTGAQLLLKAGITNVGHFDFVLSRLFHTGLQLLMSPFIVIGMCCYVISVVVWLLVLSRTDVSIAYPMVSIGYVVNAISAYYLFGESLSPMKMTGILVILCGVYLVARS